MKIKTEVLLGAALDWAVAKCEGVVRPYIKDGFCQRGPIIERELIETGPTYTDDGKTVSGWTALMFNDQRCEHDLIQASGRTPLTAAMRAYVTSKLGDEIDIPEELLS